MTTAEYIIQGVRDNINLIFGDRDKPRDQVKEELKAVQEDLDELSGEIDIMFDAMDSDD